jgi:16S rRNA (guanine527-N7)-methyltransferase
MTFPERLRQRAASRGIYMKPHEIRDLAEHFKILMRWNQTVHLTSVQDEGAILDRYFLESLQALRFLQEKPGVLVDVGSGNGFPALPLLMLRPNLNGRLLEPATRKRAFLKEVVRETSLVGRVQALPDRVDRPEDLAGLGPFDVLTMRAVAGVETVLAGAALGLVPGGRALLFVGQSALDVIRAECPTGLKLVKESPLIGRNASFIAVVERPSDAHPLGGTE